MADEQKFVSFEKLSQLQEAQNVLLSVNWRIDPSNQDDRNETAAIRLVQNILMQYQEQSYLADPYLESLVSPVIAWLKSYARESVVESAAQHSHNRVERVTDILYHYVKFRGYKAIIRFFPHEVGDLSIVLDYVNISATLINERGQWALRYIILLWLSLICMLPFDLAQFDPQNDSGRTARLIEQIGKDHLGKAGLERHGAAILLFRFYMRKDTISQLDGFLQWCIVDSPKSDVLMVIGMLHVLSDISKSGPATIIQPRIEKLMDIVAVTESSGRLTGGTLLRKFTVKLASRIALRTLPGVQRKRRVRYLTANQLEAIQSDDLQASEGDVSEVVEVTLERLFNYLQDRDTVVRWSAAKGVARIAERLPPDFVDQVIDTVMDLFTIHSKTAASMYELPSIAETTWHGASLACAEITRRGLFHPEKLPTLIDWMLKALYFDLRKGAHSIGSNVRDAAAYTIWCLARVQDPSVLSPYAEKLSQSLVKAALFDREVQIRRAASAAFQEYVGRTSLFPHGIDVLRKTDFYAVSIRRKSFSVAAPQVAEHEEYRYSILEHLLDVTLRHWDRSMRDVGAESVRLICLVDMSTLPKVVRQKMLLLLQSVDSSDIHGAVAALTELAIAYRQTLQGETLDNTLFEVFSLLSSVPYDTIIAQRNGIITEAVCRFFSVTITKKQIDLGKDSPVPQWRQIVDYSIKHRTAQTQEQGTEALATVLFRFSSSLSDFLSTLIKELQSASPFVQQSLGTVLGKLAYNMYPNALPEAIQCILQCIDFSGKIMRNNVEARRNCYMAIPRIVATTIEDLPKLISPDVMRNLFDALLAGLDDYTIDERGDVGSWIRISCVQGLKTCCKLLIGHSSRLPNFSEYLPPDKYHKAIGGILKQGVEKLDNVRFQAGDCFLELLHLPLPEVEDSDRWKIASPSLVDELFGSEEIGWNEGAWLFPRAVRLLEIEPYRPFVLNGLVLSLSSKTDVTQRNVSESLSRYVTNLPLQGEPHFDVLSILSDLLGLTRGKLSANTIVIPVLQTFNVLLSGEALAKCKTDQSAMQQLRSISQLAGRGVDRLKNVQRINECMKVVIHLLPFSAVYEACVQTLPSFLCHQYPTIRSDTAENLYILLQGAEIGRDTDQVEEILLETEWSHSDIEISRKAASTIVELLSLRRGDSLVAV